MSIKVLIICAGGMSSSVVVKKTKEAARRTGVDIHVEEATTYGYKDKVDEFDVLLIAPQIKFLYENLKSKLINKKIGIISPMDYATMSGKKIIEQALGLYNE